MSVEVIGRTAGGMIEAVIDGVTCFVPDDLGNPDRRRIAEEWEALGSVVPDYARAVTPADVKAEAGRRIEAIMPDYKQRNVLAFGLETMMTYGPDPTEWPAPLQAVNAEMQAKWTAIKAIRAKSDEIEGMTPIPPDYRSDGYWT